jgi:O-antigen/teichoic acid export membrane protein
MRALKAPKTLRALGMDGPVAYTILARAVNIVGSTATVLLIARYLTPVEQGYYYTLFSLISLQLVFELGFSFVIQQLAAHECIHLELRADGGVSGDAVAHARLASALQLTLRWYTVAALAMGLILAPLGMVFFSRHAAGTASVPWQGPWLAAVAASMAGLWCTPFYSFIEGCGQVRAVATMRFGQGLVAYGFAWVPMLLHHGLYSPAAGIVGQAATGLIFLAARRRLLTGLLRHPALEAAIDWNREVWPFQWRIAVSWMCSYFTAQVFIPILFALRGPAEAGQMGMSLNITSYMTILALAWTSTKITPFGRMIARREFAGLDQLFHRTLGQSMAAFALIAVAACGVAALLPAVAPRLAARMVSPRLFAVLVLAAGASCVVQSMATLLRSFKREPFLAQSLVVALLTLALGALTAPRWGNVGAAFSYLAATAVIGLPFAWAIFACARRSYLTAGRTIALEGVSG